MSLLDSARGTAGQWEGTLLGFGPGSSSGLNIATLLMRSFIAVGVAGLLAAFIRGGSIHTSRTQRETERRHSAARIIGRNLRSPWAETSYFPPMSPVTKVAI